MINRFLIFFLLFSFAACGNPDLVRKLQPDDKAGVKVEERDKRKVFVIKSEHFDLTLETLNHEEVNEIVTQYNPAYSYDYNYRFPQITVFRIRLKNKSREKLYFNPYLIRFKGDYHQAQDLRMYTRDEYNNRFPSQTYARFNYKGLFNPGALFQPPPKDDDEREERLKPKPKKHPLRRYLVAPGGKEKTYLCPFPLFSDRALQYELDIPYRLVAGNANVKNYNLRFNYLLERD